jgi:hypothetical protein
MIEVATSVAILGAFSDSRFVRDGFGDAAGANSWALEQLLIAFVHAKPLHENRAKL